MTLELNEANNKEGDEGFFGQILHVEKQMKDFHSGLVRIGNNQ